MACYNAAQSEKGVGVAQPLVFILNGPNLNLLGRREPEIYGHDTLAAIEELCRRTGETLALTVDFRQSNHEGELVDWIHEAGETADGIILNGGALTHTSVALLDALKGVGLPAIEVHLSNIHRREEFRRHSYPAQAAVGIIAGFGPQSYALALVAMTNLIRALPREVEPRAAHDLDGAET
jgi:3-dehydroquinate dehydratase-2